jgi:hypothetical protein
MTIPNFSIFVLSTKSDTGVPILLGVYATRAQAADSWLGVKTYRELAATGIVYSNDTRRLPRWIQAKGVPDKLVSLSSALALSYRSSLPAPHEYLARWVEKTEDELHGIERVDEEEIRYGLVLVNYSEMGPYSARNSSHHQRKVNS